MTLLAKANSFLRAASGDSLPWKLAMWGSARDKHLLKSLEKRYPALSEFKTQHRLIMHQGTDLRTKYVKEPVEPYRQIGIAGSSEDNSLLKALALYFASDFFIYHQFLSSPILGIERDRANKNDLEKLPIPLDDLSPHELSEWVSLHDEFVRATSRESQNTLFDPHKEMIDVSSLLEQLNERVYALMGISQSERWLIQDMLYVRKSLNEGRIAKEASRPADETEMLAYANVLKMELDNFLDGDIKDQHRITVFYSNELAMTKIEHPRKPPAGQVSVVRVEDQDIQKEFRKIRKSFSPIASQLREQGQWIYFNRNVKLFKGRTTYFVKPLQRLFWLKSQALVDADEFIAEKLTMTGDNN